MLCIAFNESDCHLPAGWAQKAPEGLGEWDHLSIKLSGLSSIQKQLNKYKKSMQSCINMETPQISQLTENFEWTSYMLKIISRIV